MNTFVKVFSSYGGAGERRIEAQINDFAERENLDIVSANPCFRKGLLDADAMFVVVVFRRTSDV